MNKIKQKSINIHKKKERGTNKYFKYLRKWDNRIVTKTNKKESPYESAVKTFQQPRSLSVSEAAPR